MRLTDAGKTGALVPPSSFEGLEVEEEIEAMEVEVIMVEGGVGDNDDIDDDVDDDEVIVFSAGIV
jgi:hypothetical protein